MSNRKIITAVRELIGTTREYLTKTESVISAMKQELEHDHICGRWECIFDGYYATVIKLRMGYLVTVFQHGEIYDQFTVIPYGKELHINGSDCESPLRIIHFPEKHALHVGKYGRFYRDHEVNHFDMPEKQEAPLPSASFEVIEWPERGDDTFNSFQELECQHDVEQPEMKPLKGRKFKKDENKCLDPM